MIVHIAAEVERVGYSFHQRCSICRTDLIYYEDLRCVAECVEPGEQPRGPGNWTPGAFVLEDGNMTALVDIEERLKYPCHAA